MFFAPSPVGKVTNILPASLKPHKASNRLKDFGVEVIRAFSIIWIIFVWHLPNYTQADFVQRNDVSDLITRVCLGLFVLVSGYFAISSLSIKGIRKFIIDKVLRIYPLFLFAVFLFACFGISAKLSLLHAAFLVSLFLPPYPVTLWFIPLIYIFYFIACALFFFSKCFNSLLTVVLLTLVVFFGFGVIGISSDLFDKRFLLYFPCFVFGVMVRLNFLQADFRLLSCFSAIASSLLLFPALSQIKLSMDIPEVVFIRSLFVLFASMTIFVNRNRLASSLRSKRIESLIILIGYSSFSMYLFHRPMFSLMKRIYFPSNHVLQVFWLLVGGFAIIFSLSWLIQWFYDKKVLPILVPCFPARIR